MKDVKLLYLELRNMSDFSDRFFSSKLIDLWIFICKIIIEKSELQQRSATLYYHIICNI